ncbi:unnamed protein product [Dibothriocephalus latus]|uniref:Uncharacterized protein n=1 Tax=Dibothriocephalus latus TaxID=60516 RepID=A0A3P6V2V8_DIBLA|nr:unnamed protein product [Dibothriocephalus latus]
MIHFEVKASQQLTHAHSNGLRTQRLRSFGSTCCKGPFAQQQSFLTALSYLAFDLGNLLLSTPPSSTIAESTEFICLACPASFFISSQFNYHLPSITPPLVLEPVVASLPAPSFPSRAKGKMNATSLPGVASSGGTFYVCHTRSGRSFLVDTGAQMSVIKSNMQMESRKSGDSVSNALVESVSDN